MLRPNDGTCTHVGDIVQKRSAEIWVVRAAVPLKFEDLQMILRRLCSPVMEFWKNEIESRGAPASDEFWKFISTRGAPLIEENSHFAGCVLVTFVWRGSTVTKDVTVLGGWHGYRREGNELTRLPHSDIWYRCFVMPSSIRTYYHFLENDALEDENWWLRSMAGVADPFNRSTWHLPRDDDDPDDMAIAFSVVSLPEAPQDEWWQARNTNAPRGLSSNFQSETLKNARRISIYTPPNPPYDSAPLDLVVVLDGFFFLHGLRADIIFDFLISSGRTSPFVAAFVDHPNRATRAFELLSEGGFSTFLAEELLPWVRGRYPVTEKAGNVTIVGSSYGGCAAARAAATYPDSFGNVIVLSASFEKTDDFISNFRKSSSEVSWYVAVGSREKWLGAHSGSNRVESNRRVVSALWMLGYDVHYEEVHTGHDYLFWRDALTEGLCHLAIRRSLQTSVSSNS